MALIMLLLSDSLAVTVDTAFVPLYVVSALQFAADAWVRPCITGTSSSASGWCGGSVKLAMAILPFKLIAMKIVRHHSPRSPVFSCTL